MAVGQVTRYLVSLRKVLRRSAVRCYLLERERRWEMTRNPLPAMTCCWMLVLPITSSQMNCMRHEQRLGSLLLLVPAAAVVLLAAVAVVELVLLSSATG